MIKHNPHSCLLCDSIKVTNKTLNTKRNYKYHQWRDLLESCLTGKIPKCLVELWHPGKKERFTMERPRLPSASCSLWFLLASIMMPLAFDLKLVHGECGIQGLSGESNYFGTADSLGESVPGQLASTKWYPRCLWLPVKIGNERPASVMLAAKVKGTSGLSVCDMSRDEQYVFRTMGPNKVRPRDDFIVVFSSTLHFLDIWWIFFF